MGSFETLIVLGCCVALCALEAGAAPVGFENEATLPLTTSNSEETPSANPETDDFFFEPDNSSEMAEMIPCPNCILTTNFKPPGGIRFKRYVLFGNDTKWNHKNLTYRITKYPSRLDEKAVDEDIARAFAAWSEHANLTITPESGKVDIEVSFERGDHGDGFPFDGRGGLLSHAYAPSGTIASDIGGDVHFDDEEEWTARRDWKQADHGGISIFVAAIHEFGHALGLRHSSDKSSVMYPWYGSSVSDTALSQDDIEGIQALYGPKTGAQDL